MNPFVFFTPFEDICFCFGHLNFGHFNLFRISCFEFRISRDALGFLRL